MKITTLKLSAVLTAIILCSFTPKVKLNKGLMKYARKVTIEFDKIPVERKKALTEMGDFILEDKEKSGKATLLFVCTSNSRRSHLAQVWMQTAAVYYGIDSITTFSGGTEATEVNIRAIDALKRAGFFASRRTSDYNSPYVVSPDNNLTGWILYSKKYTNAQNPQSGFIAAMVCSEADKSCPIVPGSNGKVSLPYEDPKYYDNTPAEQQKYDETCRLIARELFFVADYVKAKLIFKKEAAK